MLRITQNQSSESATRYFNDGLSRSDYYSGKAEITGQWGGLGAQYLALNGDVEKEHFHNLCHNMNPHSGKRLTSRDVSKRTVGYDFTFDVPKSLSIVYSQTNDSEILEALDNAVQYTMGDIEKSSEARVRKNGKSENTTTGNLLWASFTHLDARPVDGYPDPHLHTHCFVFNATFDPKEKIFKAAQFRNIKAKAPYYETLFHNRLAFELQKAGYQIERNRSHFELAGFDRNTIEKFSRRTLEINEKVKALELKNESEKAKVGARTRANKRTGLTQEALKKEWSSRLDDHELKLIREAKNKGRTDEETEREAAGKAVTYAIEHTLERKSVIDHDELMLLALKHSMGKTTKSELQREINSRKDLLSKGSGPERVFTSKAALEEEQKLIQSVRGGKGKFGAISKDYILQNEALNEEQREAVRHVLKSRDFVTLVVGGAGTGKTWSMKEIAKAVKSQNLELHAFSPSASASRGVQRDEGFGNATTIAALLQSKRLQENIRKGDVVWLDEAGLIGCETFNDVVNVCKSREARLLLSGDTRQHSSVARGDALRVLQKYGGVKPAYINTIQRQKKENYKEAVKALSEGYIAKGYRMLERMGAIKESETFEEAVEAIAEQYVSARKKHESVVVVSTTHNQGKVLTQAIRQGLKAQGKLGKKDREFETQNPLSFTEAEKRDIANYRQGMSIQFHQNTPGFKRGEKYNVAGRDGDGNILIVSDGVSQTLPLDQHKKYTVYEKTKTDLAKGDLIRITQNGFSMEKKRLNNGAILTVSGFDKAGNILAKTDKNEINLDKNYRNFTHAYYTTSPASQGRSVNRVLILQTMQSGLSSSKEQFYVSASRGKFEISIHTDDKERLLKSIERSAERLSATELMEAAQERNRMYNIKERFQKFGGIPREKATPIFNTVRGEMQKSRPDNEIELSQ